LFAQPRAFHFFCIFLCLLFPPPPRSTLFPYTTLFLSIGRRLGGRLPAAAGPCSQMARAPRQFHRALSAGRPGGHHRAPDDPAHRSEEHTSELQSRENLVCRLLLEKKKKNKSGREHHSR